MRRAIGSLCFSLLALSFGFAATATLVSTNASEDARVATESGTTIIRAPYAEPVIVGNCAGVAFRYSTTNSPTPSVTDDQSNTYYQVPENPVDSTNGIKMQVWIAPPVSAAVHYAIVSFGAQADGMQFITFTVANCGSTTGAITDGHSSNVSAGTTVTAGSLTPGTPGDLLLHFAFIDSNATAPALTSASPYSPSSIPWVLRHAELVDGELMQYGLYNSTSAVNPKMTVAPSSTAISIAIAIKGASVGGRCFGVCVNAIQHISLCYNDPYCNSPNSPQPAITQFPLSGNLLVAVVNGGCDIISIKYGSTLLNSRLSYTGTGASETEQVFDLLNNTPNNTNQYTITQDYTGCTSQNGYSYGWTVVLYDVSSSGVWSFGSGGTSASGDVTSCSSPCTINGASVTPPNSLGILFSTISEWYNEVNGVSLPWSSDTIWPNVMYQYPALDENNGWAHYENSNTTAQSTTWDYLDSSGATPQGYWASIALSYSATFPSVYPGREQ